MPRLVTSLSSGAEQSIVDDCGDGTFLWPKDGSAATQQVGLGILAEDGTGILAEDGTTLPLTEST